MIPYSKVYDKDHGYVVTDRSWDAFYSLMTHVLGTRPRGKHCLSTPTSEIYDGGLYMVVREAKPSQGIAQVVKSRATDSGIEGKHRAINHDWVTSSSIGVDLGQAVISRCCVEGNRKAGVVAGVEADFHTPNAFIVESIVESSRPFLGSLLARAARAGRHVQKVRPGAGPGRPLFKAQRQAALQGRLLLRLRRHRGLDA